MYVTHVNTKTTFFQSSIGNKVFANQLKLIETFTLDIRCLKSGYHSFSHFCYLMKKNPNYIKLPPVKSASPTEIDKRKYNKFINDGSGFYHRTSPVAMRP